ncbi:anti-repressor SinI family protein [Metabacillus litoralis]|nr:anti-repressor SinI family protein [Metabacillus litoralis]MCM3412411.1 anti-repressor SinI family protein [Metabacillus litoralis]UHA57873.1 anti-repressor SinI family protein [Metabacillus litoralis]
MNVVKEKLNNEQLDVEWIELMKEAKQLGLSFNEVQEFLHQQVASHE